MAKRAKERYGMREIAVAAAVDYRTALKAEKDGEFSYLDLRSVAMWIVNRLRRRCI